MVRKKWTLELTQRENFFLGQGKINGCLKMVKKIKHQNDDEYPIKKFPQEHSKTFSKKFNFKLQFTNFFKWISGNPSFSE